MVLANDNQHCYEDEDFPVQPNQRYTHKNEFRRLWPQNRFLMGQFTLPGTPQAETSLFTYPQTPALLHKSILKRALSRHIQSVDDSAILKSYRLDMMVHFALLQNNAGTGYLNSRPHITCISKL